MRELNPAEWAVLPLKKYADFSGRAPRAEYWWFALVFGILGFGFDFLDEAISGPVVGIYGPMGLAFTLATFVPGVAVAVRRLHDIGRSGWWVPLLNAWSYSFLVVGFSETTLNKLTQAPNPAIALVFVVVMVVCAVTMLVFAVTRGTEGDNDYGPDPYGPDSLEQDFA